MRGFAVVFVMLGLVMTVTVADARPKTKKRVAVTSPAKPTEAPKKKRDRSIGAPWSGRLQAPAKLKTGEDYHLRRPWRTYGTRTTVDLVRRAIIDTRDVYPKTHVLAVGDLSAEPGGWISEHASHQSGRDVDLGLFYKKQPKGYPESFVRATAATLDAAATWQLVSQLARTNDEDGGAQFVFLDEDLQTVLYTWAKKYKISDKRIAEVKRVMRHVPHHSDHIHVRFKCRERDTSCR